MIRGSAAALAMLLALLVAAGCGEEPAPTTTTTTTTIATTTTLAIDQMAVEDILTEVGENVAALSSARFSMVDETETGAPFFGTTFQKMEAQVKAPNDFTMLVDVVAPAFGFVQVRMVKIGEEAFIQLFEGAPWSPMPPEDVPFNFEGLSVVMTDLPGKIADPELTGWDTAGGVETVLMEGTVQSEALAPLITSTDSGYTVGLMLWIDEAFGLRQLRIAGQIFAEDAPETTRLLTLDEVNIPVDIELPEVSSGS